MRRLMWILLAGLVACAPSAPASTPIPDPTPTPIVVDDDLTPYRAAMRPEFAGDVDQFEQATRYRIDLTLSADLKTITAQQRVRYTNTETVPLDRVYFRLLANTLSYGGKQTVDSLSVDGIEVKPRMELRNSAMRIDFDPPLPPGRTVDFDIAYTTIVPDSTVIQGYNQFGLHDGVLTLPNFYPLIPVYDDEGWNVELAPGYGDAVYSDTALYQVSISAPADQRVVASGVCEASADGANQIWRCVSGPMRDFMIAMSADYVAASTQIDGITINSYALTQDSKAGERGLDYVARAVQTYEKRIGQYPFTELDLIETPTTAGGIEYPGVIVVAEQVYADAQAQEFTTVHESAHQWWYSLVGNDQVEEPWIDESLTQYTSILYFRDRYGADQAQFLVAFVFAEPYDRAKKAGQDLRADLPVAGYSESQYGAIVYGKAPLFFDALHEAIGDEKYNVFMRTYFERYRYGIATAQDLLDAAATQVDRARLDTLIQKWITTPEK